ncbi:MAG TPA: hydrolase [Syntrophales bacterium]|nr:hydrolase [Syntrophales bacterium]
MSDPGSTLFLLIDVQDRLYKAMHEKEKLASSLGILIRGLQLMGIPMIATEQYPKGIGPTIPEISGLLESVPVLSKMSFSCWGDPGCREAISSSDRTRILIAGIEAHVCVYQTAIDLARSGYEVDIVADAVSSRTPFNRDTGLARMRDRGIGMTSVEIVLFELMRTAESEEFRGISKILK